MHSAVGYSLFRIGRGPKSCLLKTSLFILLANLADIDFLPGILVGKPFLFHKTFGHTFLAAILCGTITALLIKAWTGRGFIKAFVLAFIVYSSHLVLDLLKSPALPVFWPLQPIDFEKRFFTFQMLPPSWAGVKILVAGIFSNPKCLRDLSREMLCASPVLLVFLWHVFSRKHFLAPKQPPVLRENPAVYAEPEPLGSLVGAGR